jgi:hypothetical protein
MTPFARLRLLGGTRSEKSRKTRAKMGHAEDGLAEMERRFGGVSGPHDNVAPRSGCEVQVASEQRLEPNAQWSVTAGRHSAIAAARWMRAEQHMAPSVDCFVGRERSFSHSLNGLTRAAGRRWPARFGANGRDL